MGLALSNILFFPIAITIVIVFAAVKVIVTVIMVFVSFTNLANLRWLWSC